MKNKIANFLKKNKLNFDNKVLCLVGFKKFKKNVSQYSDNDEFLVEFSDVEIFITSQNKFREFHINYENIIECNVFENVLFIKYFDKDQGNDKITYDFEIKI